MKQKKLSRRKRLAGVAGVNVALILHWPATEFSWKAAGVTKPWRDHGMIFNTPDVEPFRKAARDNGFHTEIKKKMGAEPRALPEKYPCALPEKNTGPLVWQDNRT